MPDPYADRRAVLKRMGAGLALAAAAPRAVALAPRPALLAGGYAADGNPGATPLLHAGTGWRIGPAAPALRNASWSIAAGQGMRYVVDEQARGVVRLCDRDLAVVATADSGGADPCHLAVHPRGTMLAVANYTSGTVAVIPVDPGHARFGTPVVHRHEGHGPDPERQRGAHAHWVGFTPDGRWLHAVDLGADTIFVHDLHAGPAAPRAAFRAPAGSGPRHLAWHPSRRRAYLVTELGAELIVLDATPDAGFVAVATLPLRPRGHAGACLPAHVAVDAAARRLYVSLRGPDAILVFALDDRGLPTPVASAPSGGVWPRCFALAGDRRLLVANQKSGEIAVLALEPDGRVGPVAARLRLPGVAFVG